MDKYLGVSNEYVSLTPSGYWGNSSDNIQTRENFMTPEELDFLYTAACNLTIWDVTERIWDVTESTYNENGTTTYDADLWKDRVCTMANLNRNNKKISPAIATLQNRLKKEVDSFFNVEATATPPAIVRWKPGHIQLPHADKELHEGADAGTPNAFPHFDIAGLFYLNDDYKGGELYFPNQGIQFKPKAGAAYFFPGDKEYIHGVTQVTSGFRYTIPFFWTIWAHKG